MDVSSPRKLQSTVEILDNENPPFTDLNPFQAEQSILGTRRVYGFISKEKLDIALISQCSTCTPYVCVNVAQGDPCFFKDYKGNL